MTQAALQKIMLEKVKIFVLVLSIIYCLKYLFEFIVLLRQDDPPPMNLGVVEKVLLYLSMSYIVTAIISIFL
jgi:hypothetical protein